MSWIQANILILLSLASTAWGWIEYFRQRRVNREQKKEITDLKECVRRINNYVYFNDLQVKTVNTILTQHKLKMKKPEETMNKEFTPDQRNFMFNFKRQL